MPEDLLPAVFKPWIMDNAERTAKINLETKIRVLFMNMKAAKIKLGSHEFSDKFNFSIYFSQEGGNIRVT